ncbi:uncharacterized protein TNIN_402701 [Trichonephila inaurata madagascariensis]|uniref:Uncharacterized protein n=1 Tax=Trichonephila inaurata madagascariensis TaxID=2747483 RepID=A0A8X6WYQ5_9ARAC|nr:uncharacterized protein TNIN_402701 [Trichonephila inaurata madagascariensis]
MATDAKRRKFLNLERDRLTRYQHQHRGLSFLKLWLPPTTDRSVNIIGLNNHIYKGKVPAVPLDQLPPDVDPESIDEGKLYREIRDMKFPEIPLLEPLGPARRVGGEYTKTKRFTFAPVAVPVDLDKVETPLLGIDGKVYRGASKAAPTAELDRKLAGSKRPVRPPSIYNSSRGNVLPTVVSLYVDGKPPSERGQLVPIIQVPSTDLETMVKFILTKKEADFEQREGVKPDETEEPEDLKPDEAEPESSKPDETEPESSKPDETEEPKSLKPDEAEESDAESTLSYTSTEPEESSGATTEPPTSSEPEESSGATTEPPTSSEPEESSEAATEPPSEQEESSKTSEATDLATSEPETE